MGDFKFLALAREIRGDVVAWRRRIHENPELSFQEFETAAFIEGLLKSFDVPVRRVGATGLVATIEGGLTNPTSKTIALRADMDALPGEELSGLPFASKRRGVIHSCGHDVHSAILLGVARLLPRFKDKFAGKIKLFFQPAEEILGGAKTFVEAGELDDVDGIAALHVMTDYEVGSIAYRRGVGLAASDQFRVVIKGKSSHGAQPHRGVDAIVIASQVIGALQTLVSRTLPPLDSAVITIGKIQGGVAPNVLADEVVLDGTLRTLSKQTRLIFIQKIESIVCGIASSLGGEGAVEFLQGSPALVVADEWVDRLLRVAPRSIPESHIHELPEPSMGGEDFAFMLEKVPGVFWRLGARTPGGPITFTHSSTFVVDEEAIPYGIAITCDLALDAMAPLQNPEQDQRAIEKISK